MSDRSVEPAEGFTLRRTLDAPRERVFRAWTEPARLAHWWGPKGFTAPESEFSVDLRPGGAWRAVLIAEDGSRHLMGGVYREVAAPERLAFTWSVAPEGEELPSPGSLITVLLSELPNGGTRLEFHLAGEHDADAVDGWNTCLDRMATLDPPGFERHLAELVVQADLLKRLLDGADLGTAVPTCPGWALRDLSEHIDGNMRGVNEVVGPAGVDRPAAVELAAALRAVGPEATVEVWGLAEPAAFWARRAAHDLLIHRADAALALSAPFDVEADLAADALSELLELKGPEGVGVQLTATDTPHQWHIGAGSTRAVLRAPLTDLLLIAYRRLPVPAAAVSGDPVELGRWLEQMALD